LSPRDGVARTVARLALCGFLIAAGVSHLTVARSAFLAQVPAWVPLEPDAVVLLSGVAEIALGVLGLVARRRHRSIVGILIALFFLAIFPGNIAQFVTRTDSFGLDTDVARGIRLLFQPALVAWAVFAFGVLRPRTR
jgi:uncharacterized membrane protein